jgi:hypothetical protein
MGLLRGSSLLTILSCTWAGWTCDEEIAKIGPGAGARDRPRTRRTLREQPTRLWHEKVPSIRPGDLHGLRAIQKTVKGLDESTERPRF